MLKVLLEWYYNDPEITGAVSSLSAFWRQQLLFIWASYLGWFTGHFNASIAVAKTWYLFKRNSWFCFPSNLKYYIPTCRIIVSRPEWMLYCVCMCVNYQIAHAIQYYSFSFLSILQSPKDESSHKLTAFCSQIYFILQTNMENNISHHKCQQHKAIGHPRQN